MLKVCFQYGKQETPFPHKYSWTPNFQETFLYIHGNIIVVFGTMLVFPVETTTKPCPMDTWIHNNTTSMIGFGKCKSQTIMQAQD